MASPRGKSIVPPKQARGAWWVPATKATVAQEEFVATATSLPFTIPPKRQPRCSCSLLHAMCELWCATGCYQTCRKLALADLVKSSGAEANRPISQCSRSSKFCTVAKKSCSKDTGLGCFPHCDSVQPVWWHHSLGFLQPLPNLCGDRWRIFHYHRCQKVASPEVQWVWWSSSSSPCPSCPKGHRVVATAMRPLSCMPPQAPRLFGWAAPGPCRCPAGGCCPAECDVEPFPPFWSLWPCPPRPHGSVCCPSRRLRGHGVGPRLPFQGGRHDDSCPWLWWVCTRSSARKDINYSPQTRKKPLWVITTKMFVWTSCRAGSALWTGCVHRFIRIPFLGLATFAVLLRSLCQSCRLRTLDLIFWWFFRLRFWLLSRFSKPR